MCDVGRPNSSRHVLHYSTSVSSAVLFSFFFFVLLILQIDRSFLYFDSLCSLTSSPVDHQLQQMSDGGAPLSTASASSHAVSTPSAATAPGKRHRSRRSRNGAAASIEDAPPAQSSSATSAAASSMRLRSDAVRGTVPPRCEKFLVCCVVNRVHNLRLEVSPHTALSPHVVSDDADADADDVNSTYQQDGNIKPEGDPRTTPRISSYAATASLPHGPNHDHHHHPVLQPTAATSWDAPSAALTSSDASDTGPHDVQSQPDVRICNNLVGDETEGAGGGGDSESGGLAEPPSTTVYRSERYAKVVACTAPAEPAHPAIGDVAFRFNGRYEIRCLLTAPSMTNDLSSPGAGVTATAASAPDAGGAPTKRSRAAAAAAAAAATATAAAPTSTGTAALHPVTGLRAGTTSVYTRPRARHYAALLRMTFDRPSLACNANKNESPVAPTPLENDQRGRGDAPTAAAQRPQHQQRSSSSVAPADPRDPCEITMRLGPVMCLPPVESAVFVHRPPRTVALIVAEVADREPPAVELLFLQGVRDILEADEFSGSLALSHVQNLARQLPQHESVIGPIFDDFSGFVHEYVGREWLVYVYSDAEVRTLGVETTIIARDPRMLPWRAASTFMEGDVARDQIRRTNQDIVYQRLLSRLSTRPHDQEELTKLLADDRAFLSLLTPHLTKMLEVVARNPLYLVLQTKLHPIMIERREQALTAQNAAPPAAGAGGYGDDDDDDSADGEGGSSLFRPEYHLLPETE